MNSIAQEIAALRTLDVAALAAKYETLFGRPPRVRHKEFLWKRIAWRVQEMRFGGLSQVALRTLDTLIAEIDLPLADRTRTVTGRLRQAARTTAPAAGTTLTRTWRGREIRATSVDGGWEHEGVVYRSLTAVAQHVTGSHWNGPLFFGLSKRRTSA